MYSKPLVSILIIAYNRKKHIAEAIKSVMETNYSNNYCGRKL